MLRLEFSEADKQALNHERYHHPHPRVQQRMEALWLKSQGLAHQRIATLWGSRPGGAKSYCSVFYAIVLYWPKAMYSWDWLDHAVFYAMLSPSLDPRFLRRIHRLSEEIMRRIRILRRNSTQ